MKLISQEGGSFSDLRQLKSALKGLSRCVCASSKTVRTKSPFVDLDDDLDTESSWLLSTQFAGLNSLPEVSPVLWLTGAKTGMQQDGDTAQDVLLYSFDMHRNRDAATM